MCASIAWAHENKCQILSPFLSTVLVNIARCIDGGTLMTGGFDLWNPHHSLPFSYNQWIIPRVYRICISSAGMTKTETQTQVTLFYSIYSQQCESQWMMHSYHNNIWTTNLSGNCALSIHRSNSDFNTLG